MKKKVFLLSCLCLFGFLGKTQTVLNQFCETDGVVNTTLKMNDKIYIGGNFSYVGKTTGALGAFNNTDLSTLNLPFTITGTVNSVVQAASGKIYIAGTFNHNGSAKNLLILNADYSVATSPAINVNGPIRLMKLIGDNLIFAGNFNLVNGQTRVGMAAYNVLSDQLLAFSPNPDGPVNDFEVADSNVWVGGAFSYIAGGLRNSLALVSLNNTLQAANLPVNGIVNTIEIKDSLLFLGGDFDSVSGISRNNLASINRNNNTLRTWNITTDGKVNAMAILNNDLYFGGAFYTLNSNNYKIGYAAANTLTGVISSMDIAFDNPVEKMEVQNGLIHVYGGFSNIGNTVKKYFAILNPSGTLAPSPIFNNQVYTSFRVNDTIWVGGKFSSFGGSNQNNMAALDANTGNLLNYPIIIDGPVNKMIQSGNQILIGGAFSSINNTSRTGVALIDTIDGTPAFWDAKCNGTINKLELIGSTLYLAGSFTEISDSSRNNLASLDLNSSIVSSWNPNVNGTINALSFMGQYLFIGGEFTEVNNSSRKFIASFDLATNELRNWNINLDSNVSAISGIGDKILVTGIFNTINNTPHSRAFISDTISGTLSAWNPQFFGTPNSTHVEGNLVFIGGDIQSQFNKGLAVFNNSTGAEVDFPIKVEEGSVQSLSRFEDKIAMGGNYLLAGDNGKRNFAIVNFNVNAPTQQTISVSASNINAVSARITINKGNGAKRVVIMKQGSAVDTFPSNGNVYNANSNFGEGENLAGNMFVLNSADTSLVVNNLTFSTTYHVAVFEYNGFANNINYLINNPARTNFTTAVAFAPPTASASNISFSDTRVVQTTIKWTKGNGEKRIVVLREGSAVNQAPKDSTPYFANTEFESGSEIGINNFVVYNGDGDSCEVNKLKSGTNYHVAIFEYNGIDQLARIKTSNPAEANVTTLAKATTPATPALALTITNTATEEISMSWTNGAGSNRIVIASENQPISSLPTDGEIYFSDNFFNGISSYLSPNERVVYVGSGNNVTVKGLNQLTKYYFAVFEYNGGAYTSSYLTSNYPKIDTSTRIVANGPIFPSKDINFIEKTQDYIALNWTKGSGEKRLVVVKNKLSAGKFPVQGNLYTANTIFGLGDSLADGSFVVSNGDDSTLTVTGLEASTDYYFAIYEYNENAFGGIYLTDSFAVANTRTSVGLKKLQGQSMRIYPNPTNEGRVNIELVYPINKQDLVKIFDMQGKLVKTFSEENWNQVNSNHIAIELIEIPRGIYILKYQSINGNTSIKLKFN